MRDRPGSRQAIKMSFWKLTDHESLEIIGDIADEAKEAMLQTSSLQEARNRVLPRIVHLCARRLEARKAAAADILYWAVLTWLDCGSKCWAHEEQSGEKEPHWQVLRQIFEIEPST